jgi:hypothetical protein
MSTVKPLFDSIPNPDGVQISNSFYTLLPRMNCMMILLFFATMKEPNKSLAHYAAVLGISSEHAQVIYNAVTALKDEVQS